MLNCRHVTQQADRLLAGEVTGIERLRLRLHLALCRHCRRFIRQLRQLIAAVPAMHGKASDEEITAVMATLPPDGDQQPSSVL